MSQTKKKLVSDSYYERASLVRTKEASLVSKKELSLVSQTKKKLVSEPDDEGASLLNHTMME